MPCGDGYVVLSTRRDDQPTLSRKADTPITSFQRRFGTGMSTLPHGYAATVPAESPSSWIKRRIHHHMVSGDAPNARTSTLRPMIRAQQRRQILRSERLWPGPALGEPGCRDFAVSRNTASRALPDVPNVTTRPHMSGRGRGSVEGWYYQPSVASMRHQRARKAHTRFSISFIIRG